MLLQGFGNHHATEAIPNALPKTQNSPKHCEFGLYAEQLSGSAFTRQRHVNLHSWLYRSLPSAVQDEYKPCSKAPVPLQPKAQPPNPFRWDPLPPPESKQDFVDGLMHIASTGKAHSYLYQCNESMQGRYFSNLDGEMLFVPYLGELLLFTEFGKLAVKPGMIAVIPRGVKFKVELTCPLAAGYLCENEGLPFVLPQLGTIGANGLANPRHFVYPHAAFEKETAHAVTLLCKYQQAFWSAKSNHSPLNVLAWHGNYAPYSYDLALFNTINTVSFDHPDPSLFTVLTSESEVPGIANLDFVIFPPRWMVAEHTFRPPYFHRNIMSELMGLISGVYDAKQEGFLPGGVSIHNCMTAHGPDAAAYETAIKQELKPMRYNETLAFMLEANSPWIINEIFLRHPARQLDYNACWQGLHPAEKS
ncbi:MAG: homogentisate 1,2-dioxygenase [Tatlockia sp.]